MQVADLIGHINRHHNKSYVLLGTCAGGTRGAYELRDAQGQPAILKFGHEARWLDRLRQSERIAAHMRGRDYPIPPNFALGRIPDGGWYQVQQFVLGMPIATPLSPAYLDLLLALNDKQAGQHPPSENGWADWSRHAREVVFAGASGWADALRTFSPASRAFLRLILDQARPFATTTLPTNDVVHGDFVAENVLVHDGHVAAVIDFAAAGCGTRVLDLARLLVWWYADMAVAQRERLLEQITAIATPAERAICMAYGLIDVIAYVIDHYPDDVASIVDRGSQIMDELRARPSR